MEPSDFPLFVLTQDWRSARMYIEEFLVEAYFFDSSALVYP
jgi:hypothetical protein